MFNLNDHADHNPGNCAFKRILIIQEFNKKSEAERIQYVIGLTNDEIIGMGPQLLMDLNAKDVQDVYSACGITVEDNTRLHDMLLVEMFARIATDIDIPMSKGNPQLN